MAGAVWLAQKDDEDHHCPRLSEKCKDVLSRLVSLEPKELCSEAIIEKCRATRDLRSCARNVEHSLTSCNHASLCAECSQRCDVCPICRVPIRRHGPSRRLRLYEECLEAGLTSSSDEDPNEMDGHMNSDVQRLWAFFDVALEHKLVSTICDYVSDVCMDDRAVSSSAVVSMLLDGTVVKDWCKRTFLHIIWTLQDIYGLGTTQMETKLHDMEKYGTKLLALSQVLETLEDPTVDSNSAAMFELQQLIEGIQRVYQHLEVMCWCARHHFLENMSSSHATLADWRSIMMGRKAAANSRALPEYTRSAQVSSSGHLETLFIEDAIANLGFGKDNEDYFLWEDLELRCLKQTTPPLASLRRREGVVGGQSATRNAAVLYPPESVRAAVDLIFLEASADLYLAKKAIFLYYLFDKQWPNQDEEWKLLLDDYVLSFDISRHAMLESWLFFLLDETGDQALEEACRLLPEVVSPDIHPKVARVLLERKRPHIAFDVLQCSNRDGSLSLSGSTEISDLPTLQDAVTAVRVRLECELLTEAYLYQKSYISIVKSQAQKGTLPTSKESDKRDRLLAMEVLVGEICWLCIQKNLVAKMIELPWQEDEEKILLECLLEQATENPCSAAGSLMVMFYIVRGRTPEAHIVHKRLSEIERSFLERCSNVEKVEVVKSICGQRSSLVEKGLEILPKVQQEQLQAGSLDHLVPLRTEGNLGGTTGLSNVKSVFPMVQENSNASANLVSATLSGRRDSLLLSNQTSRDIGRLGWANYRQPSILHGKPFTASSKGPDVLSQLDLSTFGSVPFPKPQNEGLLSPLLGKKLTFNAEISSGSSRKLGPVPTGDVKSTPQNEGKSFSFLAPDVLATDRKSINGSFEPVLSSDGSELTLREDADKSRVQNGIDENGPAAASPLFRWAENGAMETREWKKCTDTASTRFRPRRQAILSSPNGKRKAHDQLDVSLPDADLGDISSSNVLSNERQQGFSSSPLDVKNTASKSKDGPRWRAEDDGVDLPSPPPTTGGRIKALSATGRPSRSFRSHVLL